MRFTHPLTPSAREGEQSVNLSAREGEQSVNPFAREGEQSVNLSAREGGGGIKDKSLPLREGFRVG